MIAWQPLCICLLKSFCLLPWIPVAGIWFWSLSSKNMIKTFFIKHLNHTLKTNYFQGYLIQQKNYSFHIVKVWLYRVQNTVSELVSLFLLIPLPPFSAFQNLILRKRWFWVLNRRCQMVIYSFVLLFNFYLELGLSP